MKKFCELYARLDQTTRTSDKVESLTAYFLSVPAEDAAWALYFLTGQKLSRVIKMAELTRWAAEESRLPEWLVAECHDAVGDLAETLALLLPDNGPGAHFSLGQFVGQRILSIRDLPGEWQREVLFRTWRELRSDERLVFNKLLTGSLRIGVSKTLVVRALANVAGIDPAVMAHRIGGKWGPTAADYLALTSTELGNVDSAKPYPFFLASPVETASAGKASLEATLGSVSDWLVEWKWDGIRAQLLVRPGATALWSRGDELISASFPEIIEAARWIPNGTVLDGEIVGWENERVQSFARLQKRLGRKKADHRVRVESPVAFLAYDLLEWETRDQRVEPLSARREKLERLFSTFGTQLPFRLSPIIQAASWNEVAGYRAESRERGVEGLMLKRWSSPYGTGRQRGDWWKWKIEPHTVDAVLIYAQRGSGRRASLYTDYTFGVWDEGSLVTVAKAYSGLTDVEIARVDEFVRKNTLDKAGPVRMVKPELVFELAFEGVAESKRHKSGVAVRFPRMQRWRTDKKPEEADTLATLKAMLPGRF